MPVYVIPGEVINKEQRRNKRYTGLERLPGKPARSIRVAQFDTDCAIIRVTGQPLQCEIGISVCADMVADLLVGDALNNLPVKADYIMR
jgi:hypothetical protein